MQIKAIDRQIALAEQSLGNADNLNKKLDMLREIERLSKEKKLACLGNDNSDGESEEDDDDNAFNWSLNLFAWVQELSVSIFFNMFLCSFFFNKFLCSWFVFFISLKF